MLKVKALYFWKELGPARCILSIRWVKRFNVFCKTMPAMVHIINHAYIISYLNDYKVTLSVEMYAARNSHAQSSWKSSSFPLWEMTKCSCFHQHVKPVHYLFWLHSSQKNSSLFGYPYFSVFMIPHHVRVDLVLIFLNNRNRKLDFLFKIFHQFLIFGVHSIKIKRAFYKRMKSFQCHLFKGT